MALYTIESSQIEAIYRQRAHSPFPYSAIMLAYNYIGMRQARIHECRALATITGGP